MGHCPLEKGAVPKGHSRFRKGHLARPSRWILSSESCTPSDRVLRPAVRSYVWSTHISRTYPPTRPFLPLHPLRGPSPALSPTITGRVGKLGHLPEALQSSLEEEGRQGQPQ